MPDSAEQISEPCADRDRRARVDHVTEPHGGLLVPRIERHLQRGGELDGTEACAICANY